MLAQITKHVARTIPWLRQSSIPVPPADFRSLVSGGPTSEEDHVKIGNILFDLVKRECALEPSSTVLDIGCGCGRVATPMASYLNRNGAYHGVDIVKPMIDWCSTEIGRRHSNFHFHHADLTNTLYSTNGKSAAGYVFPFRNGTFDVIFATSVFTHLVTDSARQYLGETSRMLKPRTGLALLSFFLLSQNRPRRTRNGQLYQCDGYSVIDRDNPEHIVVYDETIARRMIEAAGLKIRHLERAAPSDDPEDWSGQDIFVVCT